MPRLIDTHARTVAVLDAAEQVIAERGLAGLSLRAIAAEARISLGSLTSHYESRGRLLHLLAQVAGRAWLEGLAERTARGGVADFLPATEDDVQDIRVWLSWCELARSDPQLRGRVRDVRREERLLVDRCTDHRLDTDALDVAVALLDGLRIAVCSAESPMPSERARELWLRQVRAQT